MFSIPVWQSARAHRYRTNIANRKDRVRQWAHTTAQENRFNPWAQKADSIFNGPNAINAANGEGTANGGEPEKDKPKKPLARRIYEPFKVALLHSWVNVLLVFVPVGIAVHFANLNAGAIFGINAVAIVPLAGLLTFATESVAHRLGPTLGALLNVSFGNAVELIILYVFHSSLDLVHLLTILPQHVGLYSPSFL